MLIMQHRNKSLLRLLVYSCSHIDIPGGLLVESSVEVAHGPGGSVFLGLVLEPIYERKMCIYW